MFVVFAILISVYCHLSLTINFILIFEIIMLSFVTLNSDDEIICVLFMNKF